MSSEGRDTRSPEERIKALAEKNAIGAVDAARLLASVKPATPVEDPGIDPFRRYDASVLAGAGVIASIAGASLARAGTHFPGFLDVMRAKEALGITHVAVEQIVAYPLGAVVFWLAGRIVTKKSPRLIDMLATVGFARVPVVVLAVPVALTNLVWLVALVLLGLGLQVYLLVLGFRSATGAAGGRLAAGIIGAILVAETVAKIAVSLVP